MKQREKEVDIRLDHRLICARIAPGAGVLDLGAAKLIKSNKGDAFYTVTAKACSCPAATYHPGQPCKHQRKHFPQVAMPVAEVESIRPECKWPGGLNGPVDECKGTA